jgi:hypothetical protein
MYCNLRPNKHSNHYISQTSCTLKIFFPKYSSTGHHKCKVCWPHRSLFAKTMSQFPSNLPSHTHQPILNLSLLQRNLTSHTHPLIYTANSAISKHITILQHHLITYILSSMNLFKHVHLEAPSQSRHRSTTMKSHISMEYLVPSPVSYMHTLQHTSDLNTYLLSSTLLFASYENMNRHFHVSLNLFDRFCWYSIPRIVMRLKSK